MSVYEMAGYLSTHPEFWDKHPEDVLDALLFAAKRI